MKHMKGVSAPKRAQPLCADAWVEPTPGPYMSKLIQIFYCIKYCDACDKCPK